MNRPAMWVGAALLAGTLSAAWGFVPGVALPAFLIVTGCVMPVWTRRYSALAVALLFFGTGALLWNARHAGPPADALMRDAIAQPEDAIYTVEGRVERPDLLLPGGDYMQFFVRVDSAVRGGRDVGLSGGVLVRWRQLAVSLFPGDRVRVRGALEADLSYVNWNTPSPEDFYRRHGVHSALRARGGAVERIAHGPRWSPLYWAGRLRTAEAEILARSVPESSLPFVLTVWLGDRRRLSNASYQKFVESGTAHILAVSGVHIGIIFITTSFLLRQVTKRKRFRTIATMVVVLVFALAAGARVSSVRAAVMIALYMAAELFDRDSDPLTALSLSASAFVLHDSDIVFDAGFLLSFLSVASILLFRDPIEEFFTMLPFRIRPAFSAVLSVQVFPLPVAVSYFHVLTLAGIAANLIVIPLLSLVLWLCFLTVAGGALFEPVGILFGHALHPFVFAIAFVSDTISGWEWSHRRLVSPTGIAMVFYWAAPLLVLASWRGRGHRAYWLAGAGAAVVMAAIFWEPLWPPAEVHFLDVGHGDAAFVRTPANGTLLVDGGDRSEFSDKGKRVVAPFLWSNHVGRLDAVFASHADSDHMGGLLYIVGQFPVDAVYLGPSSKEPPLERELIALCGRRGVPVRRLAEGDVIDIKGARVEVLHPTPDWRPEASENDRSLAFRVDWPGMSVLFAGDLERAGELAVSSKHVQATVLKVPHHGSATSSTPLFISAVQPETAVVSTGRRFRRKVVREAVLRRYQEMGVKIFRTDYAGGVRVAAEDGRLVYRGARQARGYPVRPTR